jgi:pimeloyl-ACP methyl ester carboxylesterase
MNISTLSRRAPLGALALILLLALLPAGPSGAPVAAAQGPACLRTLSAVEWEGSFTFAYSGSATATDGDHTQSASVTSSASVTVRFVTDDPYDPSDFQQRWHGVDGSGSISIDNTGHEGGLSLLTRGSGPPLVTEGVPLGSITVDVETCTYDVDLWIGLGDVLNQLDDEPFYTDMSAFSFGIYDRPVNEAAGPGASLTLAGSASVPVAAAMETHEVDSAGLDGGHVAHRLISIHSLRGDQHAGMAAVTWTLRPVAPQPRIAGVEFLRQEYPSGEWVAVGADGVVDGEPVLMKVFVENPSGGIFDLPLRFLDGESNELLPRGEQRLTLGPGTIEAGYMWDTTGWTWEDEAAGAALAQGGAPRAHPDRRIQVRLGEDANLYDQAEKPVRVRARPVVLVHGLNSNDGTWSKYPGYLREINFTWKAYPVHLQTGYSIVSQQRSHLLKRNAQTLADWVEYVRREEQTQQVDIVAHSMGGLISREYIHSMMPVDEYGLPAVRHLVMLGTPNRGSSCANLILGINLLHDIPNLLAPLELTPESVARFNSRVFAQKGTLFSVLVGDDNKYKCELTNFEPSDDVVLASSARYTFVHAYTDSAHTEMTESHDDFTRFVMPMLLDRPHSARTTPRTSVVLDAAPAQAAPQAQLHQTLSRTIPAGGSVEIALAMPAADRASALLIAAEGVTATLLDPAGAIVDTSVAGSPESRAWLRSLTAEQPAAGAWTLRLESQEAQASEAIVALQVAGGSLLAEAGAAPAADGGALFTLRLSDGGAPMMGASVTATFVGPDDSPVALTLHDDGAHGDGAPGDGLYGAATGPLADGSYAAAVSARAGEQTLTTIAVFTVGEATGAYTIALPLIRR